MAITMVTLQKNQNRASIQSIVSNYCKELQSLHKQRCFFNDISVRYSSSSSSSSSTSTKCNENSYSIAYKS